MTNNKGANSKMDRKELRRQYKEAVQPAGVFKIVNKINGKCFLDSSPNLPARMNRFKMDFRTGGVRQPTALVKDLELHGADAFEFEVLEELEPSDAPGYEPADDLEALLELWLEKLEPWGERGYNKEPL